MQATNRPTRFCGSPQCTGGNDCPEEDYCVCGSRCIGHGLGDGHSPVPAHSYYAMLGEQESEISLANDPTKTSPVDTLAGTQYT